MTRKSNSKNKLKTGINQPRGVVRVIGRPKSIEEINNAARQRVAADQLVEQRALERLSTIESAKKISLDDL